MGIAWIQIKTNDPGLVFKCYKFPYNQELKCVSSANVKPTNYSTKNLFAEKQSITKNVTTMSTTEESFGNYLAEDSDLSTCLTFENGFVKGHTISSKEVVLSQ